ncbi:NAD(P)/FAD-dependent oxidoreductase [Gaiella sp.]|uniref:flavin monoamine oxidase family protein n=1 Tax=Gaiella sp. TaxID=2663207 RepID=UPI003266F3EB
MKDVVVIGGGIAGLTAAYSLRDLDVVLLEVADRAGGRIFSEPRGENWLNFGAHVFGGEGSGTGQLLRELGVGAEAVPGRLAAVSLNGKLVSSGPVESFPFRLPMPLRSRAALVRTGIRLRLAVREYAKIAAPRDGEDPAARQQRMLDFMDDRSFAEFSGELPEDVDLLFRSTLTRSSGEPEELAAGYGVGYFHLVWDRKGGLSRNILGGSGVVIDALAAALGDRVCLGTRVRSVERTVEGVRVEIEGGAPIDAKTAIVATPAYATREIVADLPADTEAALAAIPYGPYVVGAFLTNETGAVPWDDLYALATPKRSFSMLFNTTNVRRAGETTRARGGSFMVYAAAGFARRLDGLDDGAVRDAFLADLHEVLPATRGLVEEVVIERWEKGLPFPRVGRAALQKSLTRPLAPIWLAGDYLGTWYTETAVQTARDAAAGVRALVTPPDRV